jgi:hypothetical protein
VTVAQGVTIAAATARATTASCGRRSSAPIIGGGGAGPTPEFAVPFAFAFGRRVSVCGRDFMALTRS